MSVLTHLARMLQRGGRQAAARPMDAMPSQADLIMSGLGGEVRAMSQPRGLSLTDEMGADRALRGERPNAMLDIGDAQSVRNALIRQEDMVRRMYAEGANPLAIQEEEMILRQLRDLASR